MARRRHHGRHKSATRMRPGGTIGSISVSPPSAQTPPRLPTAIVAKIKGGRAVLVMMLCRHGQGGRTGGECLVFAVVLHRPPLADFSRSLHVNRLAFRMIRGCLMS